MSERRIIIERQVETLKENGEIVFLVDGYVVDEKNEQRKLVKFGILKQDLTKCIDRGMLSSVAQFDRLVMCGLVSTKHIFRGLKRPLYNDQTLTDDENKLVYTRRPQWDYEWKGGRTGGAVRLRAPENSVFVIIISKNDRHSEKFPSVYGWIDRWNWIQEDGYLPEAPLNWKTRYDTKIFTFNGD